jgi:hypothetical protein
MSVLTAIASSDSDDVITEYCLLCSSKNTILLHEELTDSWRCWNCDTNYWVSDQDHKDFANLNNLTLDEADGYLKNGETYLTEGLCV